MVAAQRPYAIILLAVCHASGWTSGSPDGQGGRKKAEDDLRKAREAVERVDSQLKWLNRAAWLSSVLKQSPELNQAKDLIDKLRGTCQDIRGAADKLIEIRDQEKARNEAKGFLSRIKRLKLNEQKEILGEMGRTISAIPVGLVSERVDERFKVSADLLVREPREAKKRFRDYVEAIQSNIDYLKNKEEILEEIQTRAKAASRVLTALSDAIERAVRAGLLTKLLLDQYLDTGNLIRAYNGVASDSETKRREVRRALEVEQRRHDNLNTTLKTVFGFDT